MTRIVGGYPSEGAQRRSGVLDARTGEFEQFTRCAGWNTPTAVDGTPAEPARGRRRWILPAALAGGVAMVVTAAAFAADGRADRSGTTPPSVLLVTTGIALELRRVGVPPPQRPRSRASTMR
jgi:hypothetical protein